MKKRLVARRFSHIRHPAYKELIEPEEHKSSLYLDPKRKEFWRTDVDRVMKREEDKRKARYRVSIIPSTNYYPTKNGLLPDGLPSGVCMQDLNAVYQNRHGLISSCQYVDLSLL